MKSSHIDNDHGRGQSRPRRGFRKTFETKPTVFSFSNLPTRPKLRQDEMKTILTIKRFWFEISSRNKPRAEEKKDHHVFRAPVLLPMSPFCFTTNLVHTF